MEKKKILAVIPARAGSKGIPNKNIRIINGKPMISYCIENAMASEYITDIVVTTDSPEIELIADYYGVRFIHRKSELCLDAVTLDAVIFDACKDYVCDYVVTMQPTSPTLKAATLDAAIGYALSMGADTIISAVNKPHLAWIEKEGKIVPDYAERLNRQYLPKRYMETGAFVISKREVVTATTRIGKKIDVFEIGDEEAIDIDTFGDLILAEQILKRKSIAMVVAGNAEIGMGHICRMLELADQFTTKPDIFYNETITDKAFFGNTTYELIPFSSNAELYEKLGRKAYQVVINDILDTDKIYVRTLKQIVSKVVNFEDAGEGADYADMVINALYNDESSNRIYSGVNYYFIPKLFLLYKPIEIKKCVQTVFICFGGADPQNYTECVLNIISEEEWSDYEFTVVLGKAKKKAEEIIRGNNNKNITILHDVKNMPELMAKSDVAVTSQGRTCFELAALGIPALAISQNEREERHSFVCEGNGFRRLPRDTGKEAIRREIKGLIQEDMESRKNRQNLMLKNDLRSGRERIKGLIESL